MKKFETRATKRAKLSDIITKTFTNINYNSFQKSLRKKDVRVNYKKVNKDIIVEKNSLIEIYANEKNIEYFTEIYQDENILVVSKSYGIIVSEKDKTNLNQISLQRLIQDKYHKKFFPLHRIDLNTSGLVIFCKSQKIFDVFKNFMKLNKIKKYYLAEVVGNFLLKEEEYKAFLEKNNKISKVYVYRSPKSKQSLPIKTNIKKIKYNKDKNTSIVEVDVFNAKTHQIRAHLAFLGYSLVGDNKYGDKDKNKEFGTKKQKLLSYKLEFKIEDEKYQYLNEKPIELDEAQIKKYFLS